MDGGISRTVTVGDGWSKFLRDQNVGIGGFFIFEVVDPRCLVVTIPRRGSLEPVDMPTPPQRNVGSPPEDPVSGHGPTRPEAPASHPLKSWQRRRQPSPEPDTATDPERLLGPQPYFLKTLRQTHTSGGNNARLVSVFYLCLCFTCLQCTVA